MFLYIPKSIGLANNQLDLVVGCLNPAIAQPQSDRIQDMILVAPDLLIQVVECRYPAVALPLELVFSDSASTCVTSVDFKSRREDSFKHYAHYSFKSFA